MPIYKKESLEVLRERIDLAEVVSAHLSLQRSGASHKALCPFHEEKSPSFMIQKGEKHYHCFGCGAHGDAIAFLMGHLKMSFIDSVEYLAEKFHVPLEKQEEFTQDKGPSRSVLRDALEKACQFFHFNLLYSEEGKASLAYLYSRGIDLEFINSFQIGYAPKESELFFKVMHAQEVTGEVLETAGLIRNRRAFFLERITFPIRDVSGNVIGFSARKIREEIFGGKYINTPETPLFKKSHVLFGLSYCRSRITKERTVIVVEGQIDALRLIHTGFTYTVAGQGTAFGEGHVKELLQLGVNKVYLALDADNAGKEAAVKIGHFFQKKGVEVLVVNLPEKTDPDTYVREFGKEGFSKLLQSSQDYLTFLFTHQSKNLDLKSPSQKNGCVEAISVKIREWEHSVMVHESLKKLATLADVPEKMLGVGQDILPPEIHYKKVGKVSFMEVNGDKILETDLLRWLFLAGQTIPRLVEITQKNITPDLLKIEICRRLFTFYFEKRPPDIFSVGIELQDPESQAILQEIVQKKIYFQKAEIHLMETIQKILERNWMEKRELAIVNENLQLLAELIKNPPKVIL